MKTQNSWFALTIASVSSLSLLAACGGSGGSSSAPAPVPTPAPVAGAVQGPYGFNEDLRAEAQQVVPLSTQQKSSILSIMDQNNTFLALDDLYFKTHDSDEARARDVARFNGEGQKIYNDVITNCQIISSPPKITGSLAQNTPQVIEQDRQITGNGCPIGFLSTSVNTVSAYNVTPGVAGTGPGNAPSQLPANGPSAPPMPGAPINGAMTQTWTVTSTDVLKSQESVLDPDLASNPDTIVSQSRNLEIDNNYAAFQFVTGGAVISGTAHTRKVSSADHSLSSGVTFRSTFKHEITVNPTDRHLQMLYKLEFSDGKKLVIGAFNDNNTITVWVNGQASTIAAVRHDFKIDISAVKDFNNWLRANLQRATVSAGI